MKRILTLFLAILMIVGMVPFSVSADETKKNQSYEVVLLLDTSGSMVKKDGSWEGSDPDKLSIEGARIFAQSCPFDVKEFKISVVLYNSNIFVAKSSFDITKKEKMEEYEAFLDAVQACTGNSKNAADKAFKENYDTDFICWTGHTDIHAAMLEAEKILDQSVADNKSVILFSDGSIDVTDKGQDNTASAKAAQELATKFGKDGITMHTIGLYNPNNTNTSVDYGKMVDLMEPMAESTGGLFRICEEADSVHKIFIDIRADLFNDKYQDRNDYDVMPDVPVTHTMNIFGQITSEINLVLFSTAPIKTYVITHGDTVIAELKANGDEKTTPGCTIYRNDRTVTVKLVTPADGEWSIKFTSGSKSTVTVGEIYSYNLDVLGTVPEKVVVGDTVSFDAAIFNTDFNSLVTTPAIYNDSNCTIAVTSKSSNKIITGKYNSDKNRYEESLKFDNPGDYTITTTIEHDQFKITKERKLTVLDPKLVLSAESTAIEAGQPIKIVCKLENPLTGAQMATPDYLTGFDLNATVKLDGQTVATIPVTYTNGQEISFNYTPQKTGNYQISATITKYNITLESSGNVSINAWRPQLEVTSGAASSALGEELSFTVKLKNPSDGNTIAISKHLANAVLSAEIKCDGKTVTTWTSTVKEGAESVTIPFKPTVAGNYTLILSVNDNTVFEDSSISFTVAPSTISLLKELKNIKKGVLFGSVRTTIQLSDYFSDSDGDALVYDITSDSTKITVEVTESTLNIVAKGGAKGTVTITVKDGRGAEQTVTIGVKVTSFLPLFIILIILIIGIIIAIPIILIILKKRQTIRMKYRVKLSMNGYSMVYDVNRASNNRHAKPVMTLREVLKLQSLTTCDGGDMSESDAEQMIQLYCNQISVTGFPFKDGIKIMLPGKKEKVFLRFCVTIPLDTKDDSISDASVTFGKTTDFRD